nr:hypothetical protein [Tanacetum cinerariifolium]
DSDSDVEEDQRTNDEFMADLNDEYHERALLENQKRFYKRGGSHVTNVPDFDKEDFTSWKVRFLLFLDGLKPYLLKL